MLTLQLGGALSAVEVAGPGADGCLAGTPRPDTAGTSSGLPELTQSTSPVAATSYSKLLPPEGSQPWLPVEQQLQQCSDAEHQQQQLPQMPAAVAATASAAASGQVSTSRLLHSPRNRSSSSSSSSSSYQAKT